MQISIRSPHTQQEWAQYYDLRWRILRQPWQQVRGSEKDELEEISIHRMVTFDDKVIAVARLHFSAQNEALVRYMAVAEAYRRLGLGRRLLADLENQARKQKAQFMVLNARENALIFYKKNGFNIVADAHTLYGEIRHFKMSKQLN
ncbi:MAG: GNAT family N-acetyltransferase [Gammaproteobacteria bacterium]|nr:GNAT family N-acetyltransferase [Gammaproteobacteria bacterium]